MSVVQTAMSRVSHSELSPMAWRYLRMVERRAPLYVFSVNEEILGTQADVDRLEEWIRTYPLREIGGIYRLARGKVEENRRAVNAMQERLGALETSPVLQSTSHDYIQEVKTYLLRKQRRNM